MDMARRRPTSKPTSGKTSGGTKKGPSREQAIENLRKAWAKRKESSDSTQVIPTLDSYKKDTSLISGDSSSASTSESIKPIIEETSVSILESLGKHVKKLSSESNTDRLLKNAYGFKSLCDTYQNMTKLVYPYGLHVSHSDHMSHLFQSIMPSLQRMLTVNINVKDASVMPDSRGSVLACEASTVPEEASE